jgi:hypothetical protein
MLHDGLVDVSRTFCFVCFCVVVGRRDDDDDDDEVKDSSKRRTQTHFNLVALARLPVEYCLARKDSIGRGHRGRT